MSGVQVRRIDERLGLAVCRAGLPAVTLVTYTRQHVAVRTPSRPDLLAGNCLDLLEPPAPAQLPGALARFDEAVGTLGAPRRCLRWEVARPADAPLEVPTLDPAVAEALASHGLEPTAATVLLLGSLAPVHAPGGTDLVPISPPGGVPGGPVDRRWHAASVLHRYRQGETPEQWRSVDTEAIAWRVEQERAAAVADRAQVWIALRHGGPVARLTLVHDRQGLVALEDVVTHPAHRGRGIAGALVHMAVDAHLQAFPGHRVGAVVPAGGRLEQAVRRLGFFPHATVWSATSPGASQDDR